MTNIKATKLFKSLVAFCHKTIDKTLEYKNQGKLVVIPYQYLPVKSIDWVTETYHYDWEQIHFFNFYNWNSKDFVTFIDHEINTLPEFEIAAKEIAIKFNIPDHAAKDIGLRSLIRLIMNKAPNGSISYDNIDSYIELFINEYESLRSNKPMIWNVHLWLGNIYIASDEIQIALNVFLKRPTKEQLAEIKPKANYTDELDLFKSGRLNSGAILSFTVQTERTPVINSNLEEINQQIEMWINVFHLLKPSDVMVNYQYLSPVSIIETSIPENKEIPYDKFWQGKIEYKETCNIKLFLQKEEEEVFISFAKSIMPTLKGISNKTYLTGNSYNLAFHRYNDSLLKTEVSAYKILNAITSLEALLSDGSSEITYKIRLRVAKLLSFFGFNAIEVSDKIKDSYNLRSKLVHGSKPEDKNKDLLEFARRHTHEILNYNRICLLIALQLESIFNKSNLIKKIDNSLIDTLTSEELNEVISSNVLIPFINPYKLIEK